MAELFTVRAIKDGRVITNPNELLADIRKALNSELHQGALYLQGQVQRATPVGVTGALRRGWFVAELPGSYGTYVLSNTSEYLLPTEVGRKAAMPPVEPIELWVRRKLGIKRPASWRAAWAIAIKKSKQATPGQFFARDAINKAIPGLEKLLIARIAARLQVEWGRAYGS